MKRLTLTALLTALPLVASAMQLHSPVIVDSGSATTVAPGETFFITLESNPSTGYGWTAKVADSAIVTYQGAVMQPDRRATGGAARAGAPEHQLFVFHADRSGTTTLSFAYARAWERDTPPARTAAFTITVK